MTKTISITRRWLLGLVIFLAGTASHAAVTLEGNTAVGITALNIGLAELHDITFEEVTGSVGNPMTLVTCAPGTACDLFDGNMAGAQTAANAIQAALDALGIGVATRVGEPGMGFSATSFKVPYSDACSSGGDPCIDVYNSLHNIIWLPPTDTLIFSEPDIPSSVIFARFEPVSQVPLPPAVYLFASGLAMLGWRRRQKAA